MKLFIYFLWMHVLFFDTCLFAMSSALSLKVHDDDTGFCLVESVHPQMARKRWQLAMSAVMHTVREERSCQKYMLLDQAIAELRKCAVLKQRQGVEAKELLQQLEMQKMQKEGELEKTEKELIAVKKALSKRMHQEFELQMKNFVANERSCRNLIDFDQNKESSKILLEYTMHIKKISKEQAITFLLPRYPEFYYDLKNFSEKRDCRIFAPFNGSSSLPSVIKVAKKVEYLK